MNKLAPYLLIASLAFLGGRASVDGIDFGRFTPAPFDKVEGPLFLITVDESQNRDVGLAALQRNTTYRDSLKTRQIDMRNYDDDQPEAITNGYTAIAAQLGKPAVIIAKPDGEKVLVKPLPLPVTPEAMDAIIKEVGR